MVSNDEKGGSGPPSGPPSGQLWNPHYLGTLHRLAAGATTSPTPIEIEKYLLYIYTVLFF